MNIIKKFWGLIFIIFLSFFSINSLFISGSFPIHDDTQVARVFEMEKALSEGMFPVRWVSDLGYGFGYPIFNFYAPLAYYIGGILMLLGFDALISTKLMIGAGFIFAGISMYFFAKELFGKFAAVIASLFYVYAPYHAVNLYVRGAVGELYAYAFIPLMFWGVYKIFQTSLDGHNIEVISNIKNQKSKIQIKNQKFWIWICVGAVGYAGVILSHNLTAMMLVPFMIIVLLLYCYIAYRNKKLNAIRYLLYAFSLGLLVSAFYWLPALFEMKYTNVFSQIGGGADFRQHFVCIEQLWDSQWGFGGSTPGCIDGLSFKVGKAHIIFSLISVFTAIIIFIKKKLYSNHYNNTYYYSEKLSLILLLALGFLISAILMLKISKPFWESISFMAFLQYPWRFLLITSFITSLLSGSLIWLLQSFVQIRYLNKVLYLSTVLIVFLLLYFNLKLFQPQTIFNKTVSDYTESSEIKWRVSKISDEYMPPDFFKPGFKDQIINQRLILDEKAVKISNYNDKVQSILLDADIIKKTKIQVNLAHFPAWKIIVNGKETEYKKNNKGYEFILPEGKYNIKVQFIQTGIEKLANILSLVGIFGLITGIIYSAKFKFLKINEKIKR